MPVYGRNQMRRKCFFASCKSLSASISLKTQPFLKAKPTRAYVNVCITSLLHCLSASLVLVFFFSHIHACKHSINPISAFAISICLSICYINPQENSCGAHFSLHSVLTLWLWVVLLFLCTETWRYKGVVCKDKIHIPWISSSSECLLYTSRKTKKCANNILTLFFFFPF